MKQDGVAIVVLNYLNYQDTFNCMESLFTLTYPNYKIIIVDNGSKNGSYERIFEEYHNHPKVTVLKSETNLGFAKGNNVGIRHALDLGIRFILCLNNDTQIISKDLIEGLLESYYRNNKAAIIGPDIITKTNLHQNPYKKLSYTNLRIKYMKFRYYSVYRIYYYCKILFQLRTFFRKLKKVIKSLHPPKQKRVYSNEVDVFALHGSCLFFTELFFKFYEGFDEGTFLYMEEYILAKMVENYDLKIVYNPKVKILHFEDGSSKISFNNKEYQKFRYSYESTIYMLKKYY